MDASEVVLVLVAVSVAYLVKGAIGIGGPTLAIPVLATFMGVEYAVAVIAIPTVVSNVWLIWENRAEAEGIRPYLAPLLAAGLVGTVFGVWILVSVDDRIMSIVLAVLIFAYIVWYLLNPEAELDDRTARRLAWPAGLGGGILVGTTGIAAPVIATYVHSLRLARAGFILGVSVPFFILGVVQITSLVAFDGYNQERVVAGLLACVPVILVTPVGMWLGKRVPVRAFQLVVLVVLGVSAVRLLWVALA